MSQQAYPCSFFHNIIILIPILFFSFSCEKGLNDQCDMDFLVTHLLNRASSKRTIPKQECMVLLAGLPLVSCTEKIHTVSISGYEKLSQKSTSTSIVAKYRRRGREHKHMSLHDYFFYINKDNRNTSVPHYVGSSTTPKFPFTESFARSMLIIHKPWNAESPIRTGNRLNEFTDFLLDDKCPKSLKLVAARAKERYENGSQFKEPTAQDEESGGTYSMNGIDDAARNLMEFLTTFTRMPNVGGDSDHGKFHRGLDFDWGKKRVPVSEHFADFLHNLITRYEIVKHIFFLTYLLYDFEFN